MTWVNGGLFALYGSLLSIFGSGSPAAGRRKSSGDSEKEEIKRLAVVVANAQDGILVTDIEGRIALANQAAEQITGHDLSELMGTRTFGLHLDSAEGPVGRDILATTREHGSWSGETVLVTKSGDTVAVRLNTAVMRDHRGSPTRVVWTYRNIPDRRKSEKALRESEERFRSVFYDSAVGMALVDKEGRYAQVNQAMCEMLGYTKDEMLSYSYTDFAVRGGPGGSSDETAQLWSGEGEGFDLKKEYVHKDGSVVWGAVSLSPVRDAQGGIVRILVQVQDITERKRLHDQLVVAQKMEVVGKLAGGVAHDFNNLLTPIIAYAAMLTSSMPEDDPRRGHLARIEAAAERGATLTRQLLTFSRREIAEPKTVNLNELIANMDKMLRRLIGEHIELVFLPTSELAPVTVDSGQMEQVLVNVAINARDAMPRGGTLTISTANVSLDRKSVREYPDLAAGDYVRLSIRDTGIGMPEEVRTRLFEPFFTTKETKRVGEGSGLGLAMVYGVVKRANGAIRVQSQPGQGATFEICLPMVADGSSGQVQPGAEKSEPPRGVERVLLVEDEPAVRQLTAEVLSGQGYTIMEAVTGHEALRIVQQEGRENIDLLLTDVVMPHMSGRELADRVQELRPGIKVLFMSGYPDDMTVLHGVSGGSISFLAKPFTPATIARKVRETLDAE